MIIQGVSDIERMFEVFTDDNRIARALLWKENLQVARAVGVRIPKARLTELDLVTRSRRHLLGRQPQRPCSGCILQGRRWYKINTGDPLLYHLDRTSLREAYDKAVECIEDALRVLKATYPNINIREALIGETPDVTIRAENIDGRNGTLGFATTYTQRDSQDLDVGGDRWVSAELVADTSEFWTYGFFFTVFSHEILHILGLGHAPDEYDDIQNAFYARDRRDYGPWTDIQIDERYISGVLPA